MKHVIANLEIWLDTLITNEPINRERGDIEQADLQAVSAAECRQALTLLNAVDRGPIWPGPDGTFPQ